MIRIVTPPSAVGAGRVRVARRSLSLKNLLDSGGEGARHRKGIPDRRREATSLDFGNFESRIINGLKQNGLDEYVNHFESRIQWLRDISTNVPAPHLRDEAGQILQEFRQVLSTVNVNKPVESRAFKIGMNVEMFRDAVSAFDSDKHRCTAVLTEEQIDRILSNRS